MRITHLTATLLIVAASAPALAWGPYGPGPGVPPGYAGGFPAPWPGPGSAPYAPPTAPFGPPAFIDPAPGFLPPPSPMSEPPVGRPPVSRTERRHLSISRQSSRDAYMIDIRLTNIDPEQVQILPQGRGLRIAFQTQHQSQTQDDRQGAYGGGYRQGYSVMRGSASQRIPLPPDADLAAMSREVKPDRILLRIPRLDPGQYRPIR